jgi:2-oxoglutarate ferredoxin oxidoreductase subunit alpha
MAKRLMKGNEAIGEAAIRSGCRAYFCYPITPQTEVAEYLSKRMPEVGGVFLQAESEVAASNMIFGASAAGAKVFTTSSSPGISLMSEAISYIAGAQLPAVFVNIVRGGPGLGGILPAQSDYFQATKGGGHGDYHLLVLAPSTVQEAVDLTILAFELADKYRNPVMILGDGLIGQMMEPVEFKKQTRVKPVDKSWATTGCRGREPNLIRSLFLNPDELERNNMEIHAKYVRMKKEDILFENYNCNKSTRVLMVSYGTMGRICKTVVDEYKEEGIPVGLIRPISLFPFPEEAVFKASKSVKCVLSVEMSCGQMIDDVERSVRGQHPVHFFGRTGGIVPSPDDVKTEVDKLL